ncbi:NmrA family protein [Xylaria palmicola]|nr:NmrA family protein [Xylaria palmicola]
MPFSNDTVFVTGATGTQGGALARQLRQLGWGVYAIARDVSSPAARALVDIGVKLTPGDWEDEETLRTGLAGCDKLFLCLQSCVEDPPREIRQAKTIISIARDAGVTQIVSSTSLGVSIYEDEERRSPGTLLHELLDVKNTIEQLVVKSPGLTSWTLLRPAFFMSNLIKPVINIYTEILEKRRWTTALRPDTRIGLIDHEDIARYAVVAFRDPALFNEQIVNLATDFLTPQETMDYLSAAMGVPRIETAFLSDEEIAAQDPKGLLVQTRCDKSMRFMPDYVDVQMLAQVIPLTTFEKFLVREKDNVKRL